MLLIFLLQPGRVSRLFEARETGLRFHVAAVQKLTRSFSALGLALLIYIGFFGPSDPQANLLPLVLWTVWWMAIFMIQAIVFDIWRWISPWSAVAWLIGPNAPPLLQLPQQLAVWPAVIIFAAFQGFVLADIAPNDPDRLASFALGYWVFTTLGMIVFGPDAWLRQVECFTVLFNLTGKMRPSNSETPLKLGLPGWQVFQTKALDVSHAMLVLVVLAAGSFDGLHETFWWLGQMNVNPLEYPGRSAMVWKTTAGYFVAILALTVVFAGSIWVGTQAVGPTERTNLPAFSTIFTQFSVALLPIAIGYHFAHYFVTFLVQIQFVVANLADPLAAGWNLFGLGATRVKVGFLAVPQTVKIIWITQAGVVVLSHIIAVIMSHRAAEVFCSDKRSIIKLQIGLSLVMVAYTIFGLWLLASPKVG